jgi:hypothetical protein
VKVFNNIFFKHLASLARPSGAPDRTALPIAGDDEKAKAVVAEFLDSIGYDTVDTGSLAESWRQDAGTPATAPPTGRSPTRREPPAGVAPSAPRSPKPSGNPGPVTRGKCRRRRRPPVPASA